jgi:hypothetical protein
VFAPAIQKGVGHIAPPPPSGPKKVAIIGSAPTVQYAPWFDETYQIWTHAICMGQCKRVDRMFEMHPPLIWREHVKPQWPKYYDYLKSCPYPVYMQEKYHDVPNSVRYPKERIFAQCRSMIGRYHFGSQADFMIALALSEGIRHIALYGIHYTSPVKDGDRLEQLLAIKFWLGVAAGRGVTLEIPEGNPIFDTPSEVYGYESHSTKEKYQAKLDAQKAVDIAKPMGESELRALVPSSAGVPLREMPWNDQLGLKPEPEAWLDAAMAPR